MGVECIFFLMKQSSSKERSTSSESVERDTVLETEMFPTRGVTEEARCTQSDP